MKPILMLFIFVPILTLILLVLNILVSTHKPYESKISPIECGFTPILGQTRSNFHIHFYLIAMLFLIFDLEILLVFPLAVTLYQVSTFGFSVAMIFFLILTIGFILEIGSGAITLNNLKNNNNNSYPLLNHKFYKNNTVLKIKQQKVNFSTSAISSKENLKDITRDSYWETIYEKDIGQVTNNPHIIARRHINKGGFTDARIINLVQFQLENTITQEELDKLSSIKPITILFDDVGVQTKNLELVISNKVYNAKIRSKLNKSVGNAITKKAGVYI
jgi:NADH-ubiquinone oxidoreductase chain 3